MSVNAETYWPSTVQQNSSMKHNCDSFLSVHTKGKHGKRQLTPVTPRWWSTLRHMFLVWCWNARNPFRERGLVLLPCVTLLSETGDSPLRCQVKGLNRTKPPAHYPQLVAEGSPAVKARHYVRPVHMWKEKGKKEALQNKMLLKMPSKC